MTHTLSVKKGLSNEFYRVYLTRSLTRNMEWNVHNLPEHKNIIVPHGRWDDQEAAYNPKRLESMCEAWNRMREYDDYSNMWRDISRAYPPELLQALESRDLQVVHDHFKLMYNTPLTVGMSQGVNETSLLKNEPDIAQLRLLRNWDVLMGLCEYLSVLNTQNHEQGSTYLNIEINKLVEAMDHVFPGEVKFLAPPWQGGAWGLDTSRGLFTDRDLMALYQALKVTGYMPAYGLDISTANMCEIGGGVGYTAYWVYQLGARNITQVDLPMPLLCQFYQLCENIGDDHVSFWFEPDAEICLMTPCAFFEDKTTRYTIVYNFDSLPEMSQAQALAYLGHVLQTSDMFFHINHETQALYKGVPQNLVPAMIAGSFPGKYTKLDRNHFWLRHGYVEEWYQTRLSPVQQ